MGTYHWLCVESLGMLGIGREEAQALSILLHATWYVPTTIAGLSMLALRIDWKSFRHYRASTRPRQSPRVSAIDQPLK